MAHESGGRVFAGLAGEALRERRQVAIREIHFHALDPVHGKKHYAGRERISLF
jgi:hypothetical protein